MTAAAAYPAPRPKGPPFANASAAEVRAALIPEEAVQFDREWSKAMTEAAGRLDHASPRATLESWRRIAWMTVAHGPEAHRQMYRRAAAKLTGTEIPVDEPLLQTKARLGL
jgi:hypothetical protein